MARKRRPEEGGREVRTGAQWVNGPRKKKVKAKSPMENRYGFHMGREQEGKASRNQEEKTHEEGSAYIGEKLS